MDRASGRIEQACSILKCWTQLLSWLMIAHGRIVLTVAVSEPKSVCTGRWNQSTATVLQPGQDGMVRSRKRFGLTSEISAYFSHVLVQGRTRRYIPPRTENHGVPGSNPGPATLESPANSGKRRSPGGAAETLFQRCVNSRIEKWSLLVRLSRSLACRLWRSCR